jgi:hypothetical protein
MISILPLNWVRAVRKTHSLWIARNLFGINLNLTRLLSSLNKWVKFELGRVIILRIVLFWKSGILDYSEERKYHLTVVNQNN